MLEALHYMSQSIYISNLYSIQTVINALHHPECLLTHMSLVVRKPDFCTCENKDADQLRGDPEADQRLCFRYTGSTIPLLSKS